jgi:hypothetical protein
MSLYRYTNAPSNAQPECGVLGGAARPAAAWLLRAPNRIAGLVAWELGRLTGAVVGLLTGHAPYTDRVAELTWEDPWPVGAVPAPAARRARG